jgi:hypothetical protein
MTSEAREDVDEMFMTLVCLGIPAVALIVLVVARAIEVFA